MFFTNICQHKGCGKVFECLPLLIRHIEGIHLDFSRENLLKLEKDPPECLPFSYVLRYFNEEDTKKSVENGHLPILKKSSSVVGKTALNIPPMDDRSVYKILEKGMSIKEKHVNPWEIKKNHKAYSKKRTSIGECIPSLTDKPFVCIIPGCRKRYKNINGIKYHYKNNHGRADRLCRCKKLEHFLKSFKRKSTNGKKEHKIKQALGNNNANLTNPLFSSNLGKLNSMHSSFNDDNDYIPSNRFEFCPERTDLLK